MENKEKTNVTDYLTEKKLGVILREIFGEDNVRAQFTLLGKRYDYMIKCSNHVKKDILGDIFKEGMGQKYDYITKTITPISTEGDNSILLVEYDGSRHYQDNGYSLLESYGCVWKPLIVDRNFRHISLDINAYMLRIPYWLQLTPSITYKFFKKEVDFSKGFPHGFVSKNCYLPGSFCEYGIDRFLVEMWELSDMERYFVIESLLSKCHPNNMFNPKKFRECGTTFMWWNILDKHPIGIVMRYYYSHLKGHDPEFDLKKLPMYMRGGGIASFYENWIKEMAIDAFKSPVDLGHRSL